MRPLDPNIDFLVNAAEGWLMLGNPAEARRELDQVPAEHRRHPDVLQGRWQIQAAQADWPAAFQTADTLVCVAPDRVGGWIHRAYALRRLPDGGLELAREALLPAAARFPDDLTVPFNLACYACQMGNLDQARQWLLRARQLGGAQVIARMALRDDDLKPLWDEVRAWPSSA